MFWFYMANTILMNKQPVAAEWLQTICFNISH